MNPWDIHRKLQVCQWVDPRGSTHESQKFRKNMNKFQKNLEFWEKEICSMTGCETDKLALLGPREMMEIDLKSIPWKWRNT